MLMLAISDWITRTATLLDDMLTLLNEYSILWYAHFTAWRSSVRFDRPVQLAMTLQKPHRVEDLVPPCHLLEPDVTNGSH